MKSEEIRKLTTDEILAKLSDNREELMKLRFQQVTGQLTDTSRLRLLRRDIARMETISKELLAAPPAQAEKEQTKEKQKTKAKPKIKPKEEPEEKPKAKAKPKEEPKEKPKAKAKAKVKAETEEGEA